MAIVRGGFKTVGAPGLDIFMGRGGGGGGGGLPRLHLVGALFGGGP